MRQGSIEVYASIFNNDMCVGELEGTLSELMVYIQTANPRLASLDIKKALQEATWTEDVVWLGNHSIGIKVKKVETCVVLTKEDEEHG